MIDSLQILCRRKEAIALWHGQLDANSTDEISESCVEDALSTSMAVVLV